MRQSLPRTLEELDAYRVDNRRQADGYLMYALILLFLAFGLMIG